MLSKAMWVFFNCLGISVYHMVYEWALHLHNYSSSGSLTSYIGVAGIEAWNSFFSGMVNFLYL